MKINAYVQTVNVRTATALTAAKVTARVISANVQTAQIAASKFKNGGTSNFPRRFFNYENRSDLE